VLARTATPDDSEAIARIYNQGIEDRVATFETRLRSAEDIRAWFDGVHPIVVVEEGGQVIAFGATSSYRPRACYAGIAESSLYVAREARGRGAGRVAMSALLQPRLAPHRSPPKTDKHPGASADGTMRIAIRPFCANASPISARSGSAGVWRQPAILSPS
jgi:GNAT superfamily N-acetyltransferase